MINLMIIEKSQNEKQVIKTFTLLTPADFGAVPDNDLVIQLVPGPVSVPERGERLPHPAL